jgi:membrane protease YdiL (CAAX protease family)
MMIPSLMDEELHMLTKRPLLGFFLLSFAISWILWIPLMYGHFQYGWTTWEGDSWTNIRTMLGLLGSLGPAISAIILTYKLEGKEGIQRLLARLRLWKVNIVWWLIGFYSWWLLNSMVALVLQLAPFQNVFLQAVYSLINIPALIFFLQMPLLLGGVGEELGWRGFALPKLLSKHNLITSSLMLAVPWMFWHAPLALFSEWRGNLPIALFCVKYALLLLPLTIIFTWFFQKTKGSILLAIVFHRALNLTFNNYAGVIGLTEESQSLLSSGRIVALWLFAAVIVGYYLFSIMKNKRESSYTTITAPDSTV